MKKKTIFNSIRLIEGYDGLLFIGDPHFWSRGPNRRLDKDVFTDTVLDKISQALKEAKKRNLYPIFLGDLFHSDKENDILSLVKLIRVLNTSKEAPATIEGNHEKTETSLTDNVATVLLREAGVLEVLEKSALWGKFVFNNGKSIYLGSTPYGSPIPKEVKLPTKEADQNTPIIWLTHHNLDFGYTYPGVTKITEIEGVSMLVNGHIHASLEPIKVGEMMSHNPGNITRLSINQINHIPRVWQWTPEQDYNLEPIELHYQKHIFDLVGKQILATETVSEVDVEVTPLLQSQFVEAMINASKKKVDEKITSDGDVIKENILILGNLTNLDDELMKDLLAIAEESVAAIHEKMKK